MAVKEINVAGVRHKWLALMNYIRHSAPAVWHFTFPTVKAAEVAVRGMHVAMERNPTWFEMVIVRRGCDVYVMKTDQIQKAVIKEVQRGDQK